MSHRIVPADEAAARRLEYLQTVTGRLWPLARRYWFDALVLAAARRRPGRDAVTQNDKDGAAGPLWFDLLATLAFTLPFFARRRFPFGAPAAAGVAMASSSFVDNRLVPHGLIPILVAISGFVLFGLLRDRSQAVAGLALGVGVSPSSPTTTLSAAPATSCSSASPSASSGRSDSRSAANSGRRTRRRSAPHGPNGNGRSGALLAVSDERARIARELHDVVGHSVSVMTVQASAARRLLRPDQAKERDALLVVEQSGREALAEMRRMVGVLRRPEEAPALAPQPSLEYLDKLVEHARETGLPVDLRIEGAPVQLPAGVDLTAYRLVQEGLTNAIKHARAEHAEVVVRYGDGRVEVTVSDDGSGDGSGDKGGHGLVGMRERVSVYGGELEAGPRPEGGYRLHASLPVE